MDMRRITYKIKDEEITVTVNEDEDAKAKIREQLGVGRLPNGATMVSNVLIPLEELTKKELRGFIKEESKRHARFVEACKRNPDMGKGWPFVRDQIKATLERANTLLEN